MNIGNSVLNEDCFGYDVVVCIPYYKCPQYIRRSVIGILNQTYKAFRLVVINDGDKETPPWPLLEDIKDERLIRFDLESNKGPYFATQIVLKATSARYLLIQDADDWSLPGRLAHLIYAIETQKADFAISAIDKFKEEEDGHMQFLETLVKNQPDTRFDEVMKWRIPHCGLFRTAFLHKTGGYYGGFKVSFDTLLTNLVLMAGRISFVNAPLYHYYTRPQSLTTHAQTGYNSDFRNKINTELRKLYALAYGLNKQFTNGAISSGHFFERIKKLCVSKVSDEDRQVIEKESERLRGGL